MTSHSGRTPNPGAMPGRPGRPGRRRLPWAWPLLPLALPLLGLWALPARADSRTAESIWSQSDAQQRATSQVPLADRANISDTRCQEVGVGRMGSLPRFRCTVWFTPTPAVKPAAPATTAAPATPAAPVAPGTPPTP